MDDPKKNVAHRKAYDAVFAVLGAVLITASLAVLGLLVADLVGDGSGRLLDTTYIREDGQAPGRSDIVGTLRTHEVAGTAGTRWLVERVPVNLDLTEAKGHSDDLAGKRVVVTGSAPTPEEAVKVDKIAALPEPGSGKKPPRIGLRAVVGMLSKDAAGGWVLSPDPVTLEFETPNQASLLEPLKNKPVAVSGAYKASAGTVAVANVSRLEKKSFFTTMPAPKADRAGILSAWVGTCLVMLVTIFTALPLGVAAGIYLEEYARRNWFTGLIEINIANLAGVPSIIWGLMALGLFVYGFNIPVSPAWMPGPLSAVLRSLDSDNTGYLELGTGRTILTAGLTLGLLVLPIVIISTREAIRSIPTGIRDASYALGATKWETVRHHLLPYSMGGILTGTIVSLSRAIGETAPLITIGALTYVAFLPDAPVKSDFPFVSFQWLQSPFSVLPIQMFNWVSRPDRQFHNNAAAAGVVLLVMTLGMNAFAIFLRYRLRRRIKW